MYNSKNKKNKNKKNHQLAEYINTIFYLLTSLAFDLDFPTTTALLKFRNDVYYSFDQSKLMGALFPDLTKSFNMVDHYLLLDKLYAIS